MARDLQWFGAMINSFLCPVLLKRRSRPLGLIRGLVVASFGLLALSSEALASAEVHRLMVKLRDPANARATVLGAHTLRGLSTTAGMSLNHVRRMSGGAQVVRLPRAMTAAEAQALAQQLRTDPAVEMVEPDHWVAPLLVPNDTRYSQQWHLHEAVSEIAAANLPGAWDLSTGAVSLVIAVIDTGLVLHGEIDSPGRLVQGFDFISDPFIGNDGDARDADPSDPGDWVTSSEVASSSLCSQAENSSWHGTHVAGTIGASTDNGVGVAGINWSSKLLPVRVLGKCGGYLSDVLDGARWAAGLAVPGVPDNANPARVINMSLGANTACSAFIQSTMDEIRSAGAVVIAAAGNSGGDAGSIAPGNCAGVVAVAAVDRNGNRAYYSSKGATVALSAPGGAQVFINDSRGVLSLVNKGTTTPQASPGGDEYAFLQGTSMAAPHVAGVASLMLSVNPALTPAQVRDKLRATARTFPAGSTCTTALCGTGMLDAAMALQSAMNATPPVAEAGSHVQAEPGSTVQLDGSSSAAAAPAAIGQYTWTQVSGTAVSLSNAHAASPTFVAPGWSDTLIFQLTVTDDGGLSANDTVEVRLGSGVFTAASTSGGQDGGGGGGGGGCFIATAAFGSASAGPVMQLRTFRDRHLLTNRVGRAFVATYYALSPWLADAIRPYPALRALVRAGLVPYVALADWVAGADTAARAR